MKKVLRRALLGFPLGVFQSYTITIAISLLMNKGSYNPAVPAFINSMGSEINAVLVQYLLSGLFGAGVVGGTVVWENENWSLVKRTSVHFLIVSLLMFPIAYISHWMERSILGVVIYFLIFIAIYFTFWAIQYFSWMRRIKAINQRLQRK